MVRHDQLSGIAEGLELSKVFITQSAENAFLEMGVAKDPYEPQVEIFNSFTKILALFGANRCLSVRSKVRMWDGSIRMMCDMEVGDIVTGFDFRSKDFVPVTVNGVFFNEAAQLHQFKHSEGILECTRSHKVLVFLPSGKMAMRRVMRAVKDQMTVVVRNHNGCPVLSRIEYVGETEFEPTMDLGVDHPDHAFLADGIVVSNSGKSHAGAYKMAWDATGLYPDWYKGPRTVRGIDAWILGKTGEITRDSCQKKLFGPDPERPGWTDKPSISGLISPKYIIGKPSRKSAPQGCFDTVRVKHVPSDTISTLTFKSYEMDRQSLAAWNGDRVWIDEECPLDIIQEVIARLMDNKGQMIITLCPLDGMTPTVKFLLTSDRDLVTVAKLKHTHAKHLDEKEKENIKRLYASNPAALLARTEGEATTNTGLIFPFETKSIIYDPSEISISSRWKYLGGMDVGWRHPTAAVAVSWDYLSDVVYAYATYEQAEKPYLFHHAQLQTWGENMTFIIDSASKQVGQATGIKILEELWKLAHGENYEEIPEECRKYIAADRDFFTSMDAMWHRFNSGRLLLSRNLRSLLGQYESYVWDKEGLGPKDETPDLRYDIITALRYCVKQIPVHAHRLDCIPPWSTVDDLASPLDIQDWKPYRSGRDGS